MSKNVSFNPALPEGFPRKKSESFVPLGAGELVPEFYFVGPEEPTDLDTPTGDIVYYWWDLKSNVVKSYSAKTPKWNECPTMTKYVVDFNTAVALGKIIMGQPDEVPDIDDSEPVKPLKDTLAEIRSRRMKKISG